MRSRLAAALLLLCASVALAAPPTEWVSRSTTYAKCTGSGGNSNASNSNSGSDVPHNLTCSIDANFLRTNSQVLACAQVKLVTDTVVPNLLLKLKAGSTTLAAGTAITPQVSITQGNIELCWLTIVGGEPGPSVATSTGPLAYPSAFTGTTDSSSTTQPVPLATNGVLVWTFTSQWATAGTAVNMVTLNSFVVEITNNR